MNCPICDYKGIDKDAMNCPACHADLSAYRALEAVEGALNKQKRKTQLFMLLFVIALVASIAIFVVLCIFGPEESIVESMPTAFKSVLNLEIFLS